MTASLVACLTTTPACRPPEGEGGAPDSTSTPAPMRAPEHEKLQWDDLSTVHEARSNWTTFGNQAQWTYAGIFWDGTYARGRWVLHPPMEFAVDWVGEVAVRTCIQALEQGAQSCLSRVGCNSLQIFPDGNVQFELWDSTCAPNEHEGQWQILSTDLRPARYIGFDGHLRPPLVDGNVQRDPADQPYR